MVSAEVAIDRAIHACRCIVMHFLPNLHVLDFSVVTHQDRQKAKLWSQLNSRVLAKLEGGKSASSSAEN
jgi:hypothetical protein